MILKMIAMAMGGAGRGAFVAMASSILIDLVMKSIIRFY